VTKRERWLIGTVNSSATDERALELRGVTEQLTICARRRDELARWAMLGSRANGKPGLLRPSRTQRSQKLGAEADGGAADCRFDGNTGT